MSSSWVKQASLSYVYVFVIMEIEEEKCVENEIDESEYQNISMSDLIG